MRRSSSRPRGEPGGRLAHDGDRDGRHLGLLAVVRRRHREPRREVAHFAFGTSGAFGSIFDASRSRIVNATRRLLARPVSLSFASIGLLLPVALRDRALLRDAVIGEPPRDGVGARLSRGICCSRAAHVVGVALDADLLDPGWSAARPSPRRGSCPDSFRICAVELELHLLEDLDLPFSVITTSGSRSSSDPDRGPAMSGTRRPRPGSRPRRDRAGSRSSSDPRPSRPRRRARIVGVGDSVAVAIGRAALLRIGVGDALDVEARVPAIGDAVPVAVGTAARLRIARLRARIVRAGVVAVEDAVVVAIGRR